MLRESFVLKDMYTARRAFTLMNEERLFRRYPELLCDVLARMFKVEGERKRLLEVVQEEASKRGLTLTKLVRDLVKVM